MGLLTLGQPTNMLSWDHMGAQGADGIGPGPLLYKQHALVSTSLLAIYLVLTWNHVLLIHKSVTYIFCANVK